MPNDGGLRVHSSRRKKRQGAKEQRRTKAAGDASQPRDSRRATGDRDGGSSSDAY